MTVRVSLIVCEVFCFRCCLSGWRLLGPEMDARSARVCKHPTQAVRVSASIAACVEHAACSCFCTPRRASSISLCFHITTHLTQPRLLLRGRSNCSRRVGGCFWLCPSAPTSCGGTCTGHLSCSPPQLPLFSLLSSFTSHLAPLASLVSPRSSLRSHPSSSFLPPFFSTRSSPVCPLLSAPSPPLLRAVSQRPKRTPSTAFSVESSLYRVLFSQRQ